MRKVTPLLLLCLLTSCFKVGPQFRNPPAPAQADWMEECDERVEVADLDLQTWWELFEDPIQ